MLTYPYDTSVQGFLDSTINGRNITTVATLIGIRMDMQYGRA